MPAGGAGREGPDELRAAFDAAADRLHRTVVEVLHDLMRVVSPAAQIAHIADEHAAGAVEQNRQITGVAAAGA